MLLPRSTNFGSTEEQGDEGLVLPMKRRGEQESRKTGKKGFIRNLRGGERQRRKKPQIGLNRFAVRFD